MSTSWLSAANHEHEMTLVWRRFGEQRAVPNCVRDMDVEVVLGALFDDMIIRARGYVLGEMLPPHTETATRSTVFESPASWWQHLKHQHGNRWWLRLLVRWRPVRMTQERRHLTLTTTWEHMAAYPWSDRTRIPDGFRMGDPVNLRWMTSLTDWS